jgi:hypothetical protein
LILSSPKFIGYVFGLVGQVGPVIALVSLPLWGAPPKAHRQHRSPAQILLCRLGLQPIFFLNLDNGGATDAFYLIGFGLGLGLDVLLFSMGALLLTLCHFLNSGTKSFAPPSSRVPHSLVPTLDNPLCRVLWHLDIVWSKGLFPCARLRSLVYCPSYFFPRNGSYGPSHSWSSCDSTSCRS